MPVFRERLQIVQLEINLWEEAVKSVEHRGLVAVREGQSLRAPALMLNRRLFVDLEREVAGRGRA